MDFDAFDAGIELGGLRNRDDIRLLVCYLLKSIEQPISREQINEILQEDALANYFEINMAISELLENGNIINVSEDDNDFYTVTESGRIAAQDLETTLPRSVREKSVNAAIKLLTIAKRESENQIEIEKVNDGYNVTFSMSDGNDIIMKLTIYVADILQAETIKKNFLNDPVKLYSSIISSLTE